MFTHDLWEKPSPDTLAELARLFNLGTVITLSLAAVVSYAVLFVGTVAAAALLIDVSVLERNIGHPAGLRDYLHVERYRLRPTTWKSFLDGAHT